MEGLLSTGPTPSSFLAMIMLEKHLIVNIMLVMTLSLLLLPYIFLIVSKYKTAMQLPPQLFCDLPRICSNLNYGTTIQVSAARLTIHCAVVPKAKVPWGRTITPSSLIIWSPAPPTHPLPALCAYSSFIFCYELE